MNNIITDLIRNFLASEPDSKNIEEIFNEVSRHLSDISFSQIEERLTSRSDLFQINGNQVLLKNKIQFKFYSVLKGLNAILKSSVKVDHHYLLAAYFLAFAKFASQKNKGAIAANEIASFNDIYFGNQVPFALKEFLHHQVGKLSVIKIMEILRFLSENDQVFWQSTSGINTLALIDEMNRIFGTQKFEAGYYSPDYIHFLANQLPENTGKMFIKAPSANQLAIFSALNNPGISITISGSNTDTELISRLFFTISGTQNVKFSNDFPPAEQYDFAYVDVLLNTNVFNNKFYSQLSGIIGNCRHQCTNTLVLVTEGYLYNDQPAIAQERAKFLSEGCFQKVTSLPESTFNHNSCLKTSLVNISAHYCPSIRFEYIGDKEWANFKVENNIEFLIKNTLFRELSLTEIASTNNFSATRYCLPPVEVPGKSTTIADITTRVGRGYPINMKNDHGDIPYLNVSDLSNEDESIYLKNEGFSKLVTFEKSPGKKNRFAPKDSVLISTISLSLKPTVVHHTRPILYSQNIACLELKTSLVLPEYLAYELKKDYVKEQISRLSYGTTIHHLRRRDLLSISINLPGIEEQKQLLFEAKNEVVKIDDTVVKEVVGIIKHRLSTPVATVSLGLKNIQDFIHKNGNQNFSADTVIHPYPEFLSEQERETFSLKNAVARTALVADHMQSILKKLEHITRLDREDMHFTTINIKAFVEKNIKPVFNSTSVSVEWAQASNKIIADEKQLEFLLINLLENAVKHGKNEHTNLRIVLKIQEREIEYEEGKHAIIKTLCIANDGKPLPYNFQKDSFIKKFVKSSFSSGNGLGGFIVNKIVRNHNATLDILRQNEVTIPGMNVQFNINFPIE